MSNELPVRNRLSSLNNDNNGSHYSHITCESYLSNRSSHVDSNESHYSSINHHSNHSNYDQTMIGRDFASDILVADLAIRSTAYMPPEQGQTPPPSPTKRSVTPNMDNKKAKRRVTFKDDKELQTIFVYSSSSFISSASEMSPADNEEEEEEEELYLDLPREESILELPPSPPSLPPSPSPSPSPLPSTSALPERISKKASYDALHYRKQIRRNSQRPSTSTSEPGYWYPLSPSSRSLKDNMVRHGTLPLPELRSLEMTEKLISESIQREMALNPNLLQPCSAPAEPTRELSPHSSPKPQPMMINNDAVSVLITDTDDDAENEHTDEEKEYIDTEEDGSIETTSSISEQSIENVIQHINSVHINDEQLNTRHSVTSFCSNYIEDEEDEEESDTSVATSSPQPQSNELQMQQENQDMQESDFSKSVFNELAKRHEQTMISFPEYQSPPFEQNIVPLSAMDNVLFIPPKPQPVQIDNDSVWIDYPTLMNHQPTSNAKGLFFVKVLKAENLDFPIDNGNNGFI